MDENLDYHTQTVLHPLGLAALIVLSVALLCVPRRYAVISILAMACFVPSAQNIHIGDFNFYLLRIMVVFGAIRVLVRGELGGFKWNKLDVAVTLWAASATIMYTIQSGSTGLKFKLGQDFDTIGMYLLFRCLIQYRSDVAIITKACIAMSIPVAVAFVIEHITGRNAFAVFGGVPAVTDIRDGRLRCQGPYSHPILAGCFWASMLPLICARWWCDRAARVLVAIGLLCSGLVVLMCASSTPVMAVACGALGGCAFVFRHRMRVVRWGVFSALLLLQMVMNKPVWHLLSRIDLAGGSTGWYRYILLDQAINRVSEWWLIGTSSTSQWLEGLGGAGLADVTNQYLLEGFRGGLLTVGLFMTVIVLAFHRVGTLWRAARTRYDTILAWSLGVTLFMHCMIFLSVSYFGQTIMIWWLLIAIIGSLNPEQMRRQSIRPRIHEAVARNGGTRVQRRELISLRNSTVVKRANKYLFVYHSANKALVHRLALQ